jgi:hypothetical protein
MDHSFGVLPDSITSQLIASTDSCVAIGTLSEFDGMTEVVLTDERSFETAGLLKVFDGRVRTNLHEISVCDVRNSKRLTLDLSYSSPSVEIYADDQSEPARIVIVVKAKIAD